MWGIMTEVAAKEVQPGTIGLIIGAITGLPSMTWSAIQGDFLPAYAGSATGIAGFLFWVYKQPEDRKNRMLSDSLAALTLEFARVREELATARELAEHADEKSIDERRKLRVQIEELMVQNARLTAGVKRVENIVNSPPPTLTPDPDTAKGAT